MSFRQKKKNDTSQSRQQFDARRFRFCYKQNPIIELTPDGSSFGMYIYIVASNDSYRFDTEDHNIAQSSFTGSKLSLACVQQTTPVPVPQPHPVCTGIPLAPLVPLALTHFPTCAKERMLKRPFATVTHDVLQHPFLHSFTHWLRVYLRRASVFLLLRKEVNIATEFYMLGKNMYFISFFLKKCYNLHVTISATDKP